MSAAAVALLWGFAFLMSLAVEAFAAAPKRRGVSGAALPARAAAFLWLSAFWLGILDRPLLAAFAAVATIAVLTSISIMKRRLIGEPLVFSDFGLVRLVIRHPDLYYTEALTAPPALVGFAVVAALLAAWTWFEPPLLAPGAAIGLAATALAVAFLLWIGACGPLATPLRRVLTEPALEAHVGRWGLLLTLLAYALRWRAELALPYPSAAIPEEACAPTATLAEFDLVLVIQLESFLDAGRRLAQPPLPGLEQARARAVQHGPLRVPSHGAFTMRSEFAVLTGLSAAELGFRQFDPYLSTVAPGATAPPTLATELNERGFRTLFIHPFRPGFFDRDRVVRRLGFGEALWEDDLAAADRIGPYTSDPAVIRRILAEAQAGKPAFIMAVTMENHGPWHAGRLPGETDPLPQYLRHLASSDEAISILVDGLSGWDGRALVCLFGDHPPILPVLDPAAAPETDYVVLELGAQAKTGEPPRSVPLSADALGRLLTRLSLGRRQADPATAHR